VVIIIWLYEGTAPPLCFNVKFILIDMIYACTVIHVPSFDKSQIAQFERAALMMTLAAVDQPPLMVLRESTRLFHSTPRWLSQEGEEDEERKTRHSS
jgi:hypothetical protein